MKMLRGLVILSVVSVLAACGGGGGGSSDTTTLRTTTNTNTNTAADCDISETQNSLILCLKQVQIDNAAATLSLSTGISYDVNGSGNTGFMLSNLSQTTVSTTNYALRFFSGTSDPYKFTTASPNISGGNNSAEAIYARQFLPFNVGGQQGFYVADAPEAPAPTFTTYPFAGTNQFAYLWNGSGYIKTDLGLGTVTAHGAGVGDTASGFTFAINTPWNNNTPNNVYSTISPGGVGSAATNYTTPMSGATGTGFYTLVIDVNNDGRKDIIELSKNSSTTNQIVINNVGGWAAGSSFGNSASDANITSCTACVAEWAVTADFNNDTYEDFAVVQIDRTGSPAKEHAYVRIFINNQAGNFDDQTVTWLPGTTYQRMSPNPGAVTSNGFFELEVVDLNRDGKKDLMFVNLLNTTSYDRRVNMLINNGNSFDAVNYSNMVGWLGTVVIPMPDITLQSVTSASFMVEKAGKLYRATIK